jgi:hypothetical protein
MTDRIEANLQKINELWGCHEYWDPSAGIKTRCLAFVVDRRYLEQAGVELRLAVSFGGNAFTGMRRGFLSPPVLPDRFILGLHLVGIQGNKLSLFDQWQTARGAGADENPGPALESARAWLESFSDEAYLRYVRSSSHDQGPLKTSDLYLLQDFEIVEGEGF